MEDSKKKPLPYIIVVALILIIAFLLFQLYGQSDTNTSNDIGELDDAATIAQENSIELPPESDTISIPSYPSEIHMGSDQSSLRINLINPVENTVYFKFSITVDDEVIYQSGLVPPGQTVPTQELSRTLPIGSYAGSIIIQTYDMVTEEEMNGASTTTKFIVE